MSRRRGFSKKRRFFLFLVTAPKKFSNGCQLDNFDPRRSAYGPFESLCPKFSETHAGKVSIFKIVGARPLRSQVIRKSCTQNSCFFGNFWEKMLSHGQTVHFWPHSVTHIQKAEHLRIPKIRLKFDFRHHVTCQICGDAFNFAGMFRLWAAITPVRKVARSKSTTYSESSGRELSHGPIREKILPHENAEEKGF